MKTPDQVRALRDEIAAIDLRSLAAPSWMIDYLAYLVAILSWVLEDDAACVAATDTLAHFLHSAATATSIHSDKS